MTIFLQLQGFLTFTTFPTFPVVNFASPRIIQDNFDLTLILIQDISLDTIC